MPHAKYRNFMLAALPAAYFAAHVVAAPALASAIPLTLTAPATHSGNLVLAQVGSTGGSLGKTDKSIGGGETAAPPQSSPPPSKPSARSAPPPPPQRASKGGGGDGGGGGNYDGAWAVVSVGCNGASKSAVVITSGRILGEGLSGSVSGNGSVSATWHGDGVTSYSSGRLSGRSGSGSFKRSDGCSGSWSAAKQ